MENEKGIIEQFCKSTLNSVKYGKKFSCHVFAAFTTSVFKKDENIEIATYKTCVLKNEDNNNIKYSIELEIDDKNSNCSQKGFHIEKNMIITEESSETELYFKDKNNSVWIIRHC